MTTILFIYLSEQEYNSAAKDIIPVMLKSISSSMRRSYARSGSSSSSSDGGYTKIKLPDVYGIV